jgi:hypothetical protein
VNVVPPSKAASSALLVTFVVVEALHVRNLLATCTPAQVLSCAVRPLGLLNLGALVAAVGVGAITWVIALVRRPQPNPGT